MSQQIQDLSRKFQAQAQQLVQKFRQTQDAKERDRIRKEFNEIRGRFFDQVAVIAEKHVQSPELEQVIPFLSQSSSPVAQRVLRRAIKENPERKVQGQACLALAQALKQRSEKAKGDEATKLSKEAEEYYELAIKNYGDVATRRGTIGETAKGELNELRHLGIGKVAPEIEGEDLDGKKFKLSDYRGKVVMLDFWGHW